MKKKLNLQWRACLSAPMIQLCIVECTPATCSEHSVVVVLTSTPDPSTPPKYQTSSVMWSLSTDVPPGKKSRMLQSTHTMLSGIKVIPRHLAKLPEHILTLMLQPANWKTTRWIALKTLSFLHLNPLQFCTASGWWGMNRCWRSTANCQPSLYPVYKI